MEGKGNIHLQVPNYNDDPSQLKVKDVKLATIFCLERLIYVKEKLNVYGIT